MLKLDKIDEALESFLFKILIINYNIFLLNEPISNHRGSRI